MILPYSDTQFFQDFFNLYSIGRLQKGNITTVALRAPNVPSTQPHCYVLYTRKCHKEYK